MIDKAQAKLKALGITMRLKQARNRSGLSQTQVAKAVGFSSASSYSDIERGVNPLTTEMLIMLCQLYDIDIAWAVTGFNPTFDRRKLYDILEKSKVAKQEQESLLDMLESFRQDTDIK